MAFTTIKELFSVVVHFQLLVRWFSVNCGLHFLRGRRLSETIWIVTFVVKRLHSLTDPVLKNAYKALSEMAAAYEKRQAPITPSLTMHPKTWRSGVSTVVINSITNHARAHTHTHFIENRAYEVVWEEQNFHGNFIRHLREWILPKHAAHPHVYQKIIKLLPDSSKISIW